MQTFRPGKHSCPFCKHEMDCATPASDDASGPGDGDVGVCIRCSKPFFYTVKDGEFGTRSPSPEEYEELSKDEDVAKARMIVREAAARSRANRASN